MDPASRIIASENAKGGKTEARTAVPWWVGRILWCDKCGHGTKLEVDDLKRAHWVDTKDLNVVRIRCLKCKAEIEVTGGLELKHLTIGQLEERSEHGDPQAAAKISGAIHIVMDLALNAPNTTRGKVALAFLLRRFIPEFFASSAWRLTRRRPCQLSPEWMAISEKALSDKILALRIRGGGATPLLVKERELVGAEYQEAKERCLATKHILWPRRLSMTEQVRYGLLSASDKALIEICERGTPREFLEGLLLPRLEKKYPDLEALKKGDPRLFSLYFRRKHRPKIKVSGALRSDCRNHWHRTVAPNLERTGRFGKARKSLRDRCLPYRTSVAAMESALVVKSAKIAACKPHKWIEWAPGLIPAYVRTPWGAPRNSKGVCFCIQCGKREEHEAAHLERMLQINLERNNALESLDEAKIRAFAWKWHRRRLSEDPQEFWWQIAEAITIRPPRPKLSSITIHRLHSRLAAELGKDWEAGCRERLARRGSKRMRSDQGES